MAFTEGWTNAKAVETQGQPWGCRVKGWVSTLDGWKHCVNLAFGGRSGVFQGLTRIDSASHTYKEDGEVAYVVSLAGAISFAQKSEIDTCRLGDSHVSCAIHGRTLPK